jgi:hypothetical protein
VKRTIPLANADELDALTKWRHYYCYLRRAGVAKKVKRQFNRRERRDATNRIEEFTRELD